MELPELKSLQRSATSTVATFDALQFLHDNCHTTHENDDGSRSLTCREHQAKYGPWPSGNVCGMCKVADEIERLLAIEERTADCSRCARKI